MEVLILLVISIGFLIILCLLGNEINNVNLKLIDVTSELKRVNLNLEYIIKMNER